MLLKILFVVLILWICIDLALAMRKMINPDSSQIPMSKWLGRRVLFSAITVLIIVLTSELGWLQLASTPH